MDTEIIIGEEAVSGGQYKCLHAMQIFNGNFIQLDNEFLINCLIIFRASIYGVFKKITGKLMICTGHQGDYFLLINPCLSRRRFDFGAIKGFSAFISIFFSSVRNYL